MCLCLMQLVAYGAQDAYLTGNPRSLSLRSYSRHTQLFDGSY